MARKDETEIAIGVMRIAANQPSDLATFKRCRADMPGFMNFSAEDNALSGTRPGETMWHQQVRNIRSHHAAGGNAIDRGWLVHIPRIGYRITSAGKAQLASLGLHP